MFAPSLQTPLPPHQVVQGVLGGVGFTVSTHFLLWCSIVVSPWYAVPSGISSCSCIDLPWVAVWRSAPPWSTSFSCSDLGIPSGLSHSFCSCCVRCFLPFHGLKIFARETWFYSGTTHGWWLQLCPGGGPLQPAGTSYVWSEAAPGVVPQRPPCSPHTDSALPLSVWQEMHWQEKKNELVFQSEKDLENYFLNMKKIVIWELLIVFELTVIWCLHYKYFITLIMIK